MRRVLAFLLVLTLLTALVPCAFAVSAEADRAANDLYALGLFQGVRTSADGRPDFALDQAPNRFQAITMLVRLLGKEDAALAGQWTTPFTDVDDWAAPYVGYAYANGLTDGVTDTRFDGKTTVTATQYLTFVLRALGYASGTDFAWDSAWTLTDRLGVTAGEYTAANNKNFLRADVALISRSALRVSRKDSTENIWQTVCKNKIVGLRLNGGEKSWAFRVVLYNWMQEPVTLEKLQIVKTLDGQDIGEKWIFTGDRLANLNLLDLRLMPGEQRLFIDNHPEVDYFDGMGYTFTFRGDSGKTYVMEYLFALRHQVTDGAYADYSKNNGRDLATLRYDARFEVQAAPGVWWVPARTLGESSYTNAQVQAMLTDTPAQKQAKIDTLYEALQLYQIGNFYGSDDNIRIREGGVDWEHHKPGYDAVRTNNGCCATDSNWLRYILDGDYDEVGYIATSQRDGSGHIYNYIKQDGWYYVIDLTHYRTDWVSTAVETGNPDDYYSTDRILGNIHKVRGIQDYVNYVQEAFSDPPGLMFMYTAESCLAVDSVRSGSGVTITYETAPGVSVQIIFDDPSDSLTAAFVTPPQQRADWSALPDFNFAGMFKN